MSAEVYTATLATQLAELVHRLPDHGQHLIPVADEKRKPVGMVTQSDLINTLNWRRPDAHNTPQGQHE